MATIDALSLQSRVKLNDSYDIPILGFGTYEMDGRDAYRAVTYALETGYRLIDSAEWYYNEMECGQAIRDFMQRTEIPREEICYTTKLMSNRGIQHARSAIRKSVKACGLGYIDIYLLHSPMGGFEMRKESWLAALEAKEEGLIRSIGVSNFSQRHLKEFAGAGFIPVLNQIDLHPFMTRRQVVEYCQPNGILLEAWAPLVRGLRFKHPVIQKIARAHDRKPSQVLLRYSLQKGYIPLPKSVSPSRIVENSQIFDFELTENDMDALDNLDEYLVTDWDPTDAE
ncbi:Aldo/keto reductase [Calocera viscosa TUFC12733]|uniref:Aldo/keto reductase n=1 Tax=Calocera viscosa (strain TUFC12733) TaxID=1330018 RepID=A0A167QDX2_CALVF|nr:Aldo/keto reductase [Calocera viscosa TUFC12733]